MVSLPSDIWPLVCQHLRFEEIVRLQRASHAVKAATDHESFYKDVALLQWGSLFWEKAFSRFPIVGPISMRRELMCIHRLRMQCEYFDVPMWTLR